jgi:serine/threonine protein kinase
LKFLRDFQDPVKRKDFSSQVAVLSWPRRGVVPVIASDTTAPRPWYAMPYYPGGELSRYAGKLSHQQLLAVADHLARILSEFHASAGAFGDFKPANILVSPQGFPMLADPLGNGKFGLLGLLFPQRQGGTPGYMAPEVKAGGPMSIQADVYSFAAALTHLVTGRAPQDGQQLDVGLQCPGVIRELIIACLQTDPNVRATMKEVRQIMNGSTWKGIQNARQHAKQQMQEQLQGLVTLGLIVGVGALALSALGGSGA